MPQHRRLLRERRERPRDGRAAEQLADDMGRGHRVTQGQRGELGAAAGKERVGRDQQHVGSLLDKGRKSRIDLSVGAGVKHVHLEPKGPSTRLQIFDKGFSQQRGGIDERDKARGLRQQLMQQPEQLCSHLRGHEADAGDVAARPVEARHEAERDRMGEPPFRNPITGIAGCCARAASRQATNAPPSSVMNSPRFS